MKSNFCAQIILISLLGIMAFAQMPTPTPSDRSRPVTVDQGFVDDATQAFATVKAQRDVIEKFMEERGMTREERAAAIALVKGLNDFLALKDKMLEQYSLWVDKLQKIIDLQFKIIDKQNQMLNKPKGFWQKLFNSIKEVLKAATYILVGRGIGSLIRSYDPDTGIIIFRSRFDWELFHRKDSRIWQMAALGSANFPLRPMMPDSY